MQSLSPLDGTSCVVMNAASGQWQSYHCGTPLPYICKKSLDEVSSLPGRTACAFLYKLTYGVLFFPLPKPFQASLPKCFYNSFEVLVEQKQTLYLRCQDDASQTALIFCSFLIHTKSISQHGPALFITFSSTACAFFSCVTESLDLAIAS